MGQPHQVLIIEPRRSVRTMLEMILCGEGLQVFAATSLHSALLQLRVLQPDLIILGTAGAARDGGGPRVQAVNGPQEECVTESCATP